MRVRRSLSVARRIVLGLRHDPRTVALILLGPIVAMFVFGLAFSGDVRHVRVGVVDLDAGMELPFIGTMSLSERIVDNLDPAVIEAVEVESEAIAGRWCATGELAALVVFPEGFTEKRPPRARRAPHSGASARIRIRLDRTVFNVAAAVTRSFMGRRHDDRPRERRELPVSVDTDDPIYGRGASFMDFFVPGVMGFAGFMLTALLTILSFVARSAAARSTAARHAALGGRAGCRVRGGLRAYRRCPGAPSAWSGRGGLQRDDRGHGGARFFHHRPAVRGEPEPGDTPLHARRERGSRPPDDPAHRAPSFLLAGIFGPSRPFRRTCAASRTSFPRTGRSTPAARS